MSAVMTKRTAHPKTAKTKTVHPKTRAAAKKEDTAPQADKKILFSGGLTGAFDKVCGVVERVTAAAERTANIAERVVKVSVRAVGVVTVAAPIVDIIATEIGAVDLAAAFAAVAPAVAPIALPVALIGGAVLAGVVGYEMFKRSRQKQQKIAAHAHP